MWTKEKRTKGISYIAFSVSTIKISWLGYLNYCRPNYTQRNKLRGVYAYIIFDPPVRQLARQPLVSVSATPLLPLHGIS